MITIEGLSYVYPDGTHALRSLSFEIHDGEMLLLCGSNGSGKTTLLRHLNGLLKPTEGRILLDGIPIAENPKEVVQRVGMVFQDPDSQILGETVWEDIAFGPENLGLPREQVEARVRSALELTGLQDLATKSCLWLSGGQRKRLAIAGVLALDPDVLVFDEPFASLDYTSARQILQQIVHLHESGRTVILSTHDIEKVLAHADRIALLSAGEMRLLDSPLRVLPDLAHHGVRPPCHHLMGLPVPSWLDS